MHGVVDDRHLLIERGVDLADFSHVEALLPFVMSRFAVDQLLESVSVVFCFAGLFVGAKRSNSVKKLRVT